MPSEWRKRKFHAMTHIGDDIRDTCEMEYILGSFHELYHNIFKQDYRLISKRLVSYMEEALNKGEEREFFRSPVRQSGNKFLCTANQWS